MLLWTVASYAAPVEVKIDRNPVSIDESFQLTFSASAQPDGEPDFSPLQQDFTILDRQQSSSMSWVNGQTSRKIEWVLTVMAKNTGALLVPAIAFGSDHSRPLTIAVTRGQVAQDSQADVRGDLFLEVEATPEQPWVQSQVLYRLKIYRRVELGSRSQLTEPAPKDVLVSKLGGDSEYSKQINGVDYRVIERRYALFPQKSGKLTIEPATLIADVLLQDRQGFGRFFSQSSKTVRVNSRALTLNVQPVPQNFKAPQWLSAEHLELQQQWSGDLTVKVGEPLTRTVRLSAKGSTVGQLPTLFDKLDNADLKLYPDQPLLNEQAETDGLLASREEKVALIANKPGVYQLPALELPWFNTRTRQIEVARLPAVTITALADGKTTAQPAAPVAVDSEAKQTPSVLPQPVSPDSADNHGLWLGLALFALSGWLVTAVAWWWTLRKKAPVQAATAPDGVSDDGELIKRLKAACAADDAQAAKTALLLWGRQRYQAASLGALAEHCQARLRDELLLLNQHLYARSGQAWQGKKLWQSFSEHKALQQLATKAPAPVLEPLHKL